MLTSIYDNGFLPLEAVDCASTGTLWVEKPAFTKYVHRVSFIPDADVDTTTADAVITISKTPSGGSKTTWATITIPDNTTAGTEVASKISHTKGTIPALKTYGNVEISCDDTLTIEVSTAGAGGGAACTGSIKVYAHTMGSVHERFDTQDIR